VAGFDSVSSVPKRLPLGGRASLVVTRYSEPGEGVVSGFFAVPAASSGHSAVSIRPTTIPSADDPDDKYPGAEHDHSWLKVRRQQRSNGSPQGCSSEALPRDSQCRPEC
jgi:hypothetical protein